MTKNHVGRGNPAVTGQCKIKASAHAMSFNSGDDGRWIAGDLVHQRLAYGGEREGLGTLERSDFIQISANRKKLPIARNDQWTKLFFQFVNRDAQCEHAPTGKTIDTVA
jgi:hypothetical protein